MTEITTASVPPGASQGDTGSVGPMADLATIDEALAAILGRSSPLDAEAIGLDAAAGRVLARAATAVVDLPPFPSSAMDGYAIRSTDVPGELGVVATSAAGRPASRTLAAGEAIAISTGAVVPEGADAVVPVEVVVEYGNRVAVASEVAPGANIRPRAGDIRAGEEVVPAGARLSGAHVGALAAAGVTELVCARRPRVRVLTTGTELKPPGTSLRPGEIYESNGPMLRALLAAAGADVELLPAVDDDRAAHRAAIAEGLEADVLVTSGGVSVGQHDLVRDVERELGAEEVFWGVAMRAGKPRSFAVRGATLVFVLPGNPVSSLVSALLFVRPALLALQGATDAGPPWAAGILGVAVRRATARDELSRARSELTEAGVVLTPVDGQESHMITRAATADSILHVPRGEGELPAGAAVRYLRLD
jgi:molybdopterin molybdotransferase